MQHNSSTQSIRVPYFWIPALLGLIILAISIHSQASLIAQIQSMAASSPAIQSCTAAHGIDLMSGNVSYGEQDIQGALPYTRQYKGVIRANLTAANDFYDPFISTSGWTDNYSSTVRKVEETNSTGSVAGALYIIRLPGESQDIGFYINLNANTVSRLYTSDVLFSTVVKAPVKYSTDLGEYQITRTGTTISSISRYGIRYDIGASIYRPSSASYYSKISKIVNPATGSILNLSYDSQLNLTQVSDNRNNILTFDRNYKADTSSTAAQTEQERRAISKVTLRSGINSQGQIDQQTVSYSYNLIDTTDFDGDFYTSPQLMQSNNPRYGLKNYQYSAVLQPALNAYRYMVSNGAENTNYTNPILSQISNGMGHIERIWTASNSYSNSTWAGTASLRSYVPVNGATVFDMTASYNDSGISEQGGSNSSGIGLSYRQSADNNTFSTLSLSSSNNTGNLYNNGATFYNWSPTYRDNNLLTVNVGSGSFPCLTVQNKPLKSIEMDVWRSHSNRYTDANGISSSISYDNNNRITQIIEAVGYPEQRSSSYVYGNLNTGAINLTSTPTTATLPNLVVTNTLDGLGRLIQQTRNSSSSQSGSQLKTYTYSYYNDSTQPNDGLLQRYDGSRSTDSNGQALDDSQNYSYDNYGNLSQTSYIVGNTVRQQQYLQYNSAGQPKYVVSENGQATQTDYDTGYRPTKVMQGDWSTGAGGTLLNPVTVSQTAYDSLGRPISSSDADGLVTQYSYNSANQLTQVTAPNGSQEIRSYHPNGALKSIGQRLNASSAIISSQSQTLDINGRTLRSQTGSDSTQQWVEYSYDGNGNLLTRSSPSPTGSGNAVDMYTYDALNRVKIHTNPLGHKTTYGHDAADNTESIRLPNGSTTTRTFKDHRILSTETLSDYDAQSYSTDLADNIIEAVHGTRTCAQPQYDQLSRMQQQDCSSSANSTAMYNVSDQYIYDQTRFGRLDRVASLNGSGSTTVYGYDNFDRVTSKTQQVNYPVTPRAVALSVGYAYRLSGKLASITYPSGQQVRYNYHANNGDLVGLDLAKGNTVAALLTNLSYDGSNRLTTWDYGHSAGSMLYRYNALDQLDAVEFKQGTNVLFGLGYGFNADGSIASQNINGRSLYTYGYDKIGQLTSETGSGFSINYAFWTNGNRKTVTASGTANPLGYSNAVFSPRNDSNRLSQLTYDGVDQGVYHLATGETGLDTIGTAGYDHKGRRTWESGTPDGLYTSRRMEYNHNNERTFLWGGNSSTTVNGVTTTSTLTRQYVYDEASHLIGEYNRDGTPIVEYVWLGDKPVATLYPNGRIVYLITDHQNKPRRGYDPNIQRFVWTWDPDAFGVKPASASQNIVQNLRFPGQVYDVATGLHYNHNRFYNPKLGRYMEPDPIKLEGGNNPYVYVGNDPVNLVDPSGLFGIGNNDALNYSIDNTLNFNSNSHLNGLQLSFENAYSQINNKFSESIVAMGYAGTAYVNWNDPRYTPKSPISIMQNRYYDMKSDNTVGNDKYFHCLAHCEATQAGGIGIAASQIIGLTREVTDMVRPDKWDQSSKDWQGSYRKTLNYKWQDTKADMDANRTGREGGKTGNACYSVCSPYVVPGINKRYLKNGNP